MAATSETRHVFGQILKKAGRKKGNDKKPLVTEKESEIVENLERSLKKDDPLSENNMYDEEAERNLKNLRNSGQIKGKENQDSADKTCMKRPLPTPSDSVKRVPVIRKHKRGADNKASSSAKLESAYNQEVFSQVTDRLFHENTRAINLSQRNDTPSNSSYEAAKMSLNDIEQARKACHPSAVSDENGVDSPDNLHINDFESSSKGLKHDHTKRLKSNVKEKANTGIPSVPVSVTVMDIHSVDRLFDTVWRKHTENMNNKSIMSSLGKSHWAKVKTNIRSPDKTLQRCDLSSNPLPDNDMKACTSDGGTLGYLASETDINKTVWQTLSQEVIRQRGSEESLHKIMGSRSESDGMHDDGFKSLEKLFIDECTSKTGLSGEALIKMSDSIEKEEFWKGFWKEHGVEIEYESERLIENAADPTKKVTKEKKKKPKKKGVDTTKEEEVYAVVNKPAKKRDKKNDDRQDIADPDDDVKPNPKPAPRKPKSKTALEQPAVDEPAETIAKTVEEQTEETVPKIAVRKKRRKKATGDTPRSLPAVTQNDTQHDGEPMPVTEDASTSVASVQADQPPEQQIEDDGTILGVRVHNCDYIRIDPKYIAHPVVKVSVVDSMTGKYINKHDTSRHVSSYYESDAVQIIMPLMTQPFDFKAKGSLLPRWEELLTFNESFTRLTNLTVTPTTNRPIIFFVVRDFITMQKANNVKEGGEKGWHNVAWAFLKLVSNNGQPNAGRKMRLQLFHPPRSRGYQDPTVDMAHDWWLNHPRRKYPGTLYVTVKAIFPAGDLESSLRSLSAFQKEESSLTYNQLNESLERSASESLLRNELDELAEIQQWSRLPGQTCKIPNAPFMRLFAGSDGAFVMKFSHRGTRLAVACRHGSTYPIILYSIPSGVEIGAITGHQQLVYDLKWSKNDRFLLSASADGTAQVWDVEEIEKPIQTLPHPCYVYTASYHSIASHLIATGGYDSTVRVWNIVSKNSQLTQEMDGHKSIVNSIIFDSTGLNMFSGDGAGVIICWDCRSYEKAKKNVKTNWSIKYKIEDRDLKGICINHLELHPRNNKILVHCRDSTVRLLDSRIHSIKKFTGLINYRQLLRSSITPCGSLIFSGSEDGCVYVWNVETGDQLAVYNELGYINAVHTVIYHPHDHIVAFCSFSPSQSILLYKFNSAVATMEAGFKPTDSIEVKDDDTSMSMHAQIEAAKTAVNLERVKSKLDSVLDISQDEGSRSSVTQGRPLADPSEKSPRSMSPYRRGGHLSSMESTFNDNSNLRSTGNILAPSFLSPHANPEARAMAHQYIRTGHQDQRPVASVGGSPYRSGVAPDVSFATDNDGNTRLNVNAPPGTQQQCLVIALFEYEANRSDELSFVRGDLMKLLYKDSPNWWFGEMVVGGKQGYFPSNYVEEQVSTAQMQQGDAQTPVFGVPDTTPEKKVYALKMPGGRLNFYSQSESEGDDDRLSSVSLRSSRQRRREAKLQNTFEKPNQSQIPSTSLTTPAKSDTSTYPKSILLKESSRPRTPLQGSSNTPSIKEVSFADEKNDKDPKARQNLMESIQAALKKAEQDTVASDKPSTSTKINEQGSRPRAAVRKASQRKTKGKSPSVEETTFIKNVTTETNPPSSTPRLAPSFGILKSVQALMNKNEESQFSQSVLGGHAASTPVKSNSETFHPAVHSTAIKKVRSPVENEDETLAAGSTVRKARPLPKFGAKQTDEETIPMVKMSRSKSAEVSRSGALNPAFVADT